MFRVRNALSGKEEKFVASRIMEVKAFRDIIAEKFGVKPELQRLMFMGKEMKNSTDDGKPLSLFDYDVKVNCQIQLFPRQPLADSSNLKAAEDDNKSTSPAAKATPSKDNSEKSDAAASDSAEDKPDELQWSVDCYADVLNEDMGAWFTGCIKEVIQSESGQMFKVEIMEDDPTEGDDPWVLTVKEDKMRPVSYTEVSINDLKEKDAIFVNYNFDCPDPPSEEVGFWYDAIISSINCKKKEIVCDIRANELVKGITISGDKFKKFVPITESGDDEELDCEKCKKNPKRKCKQCGCAKCGGKHDPDSILMCDECNDGYHLKCLGLTTLPSEDEWYCPECFNQNDIVGEGGKSMKARAKKSTTKDWGSGYNTAGRDSECTIVPKDHFGPIPGIEVGMSWLLRIQVSSAGVHRPHVAGIAGQSDKGCQSIVLSGGYEDDKDLGEQFYYTGSGGRDLSGNKRTAEQSFDQELKGSNEALARSCKAPINKKTGGDAGDDWKQGKPIRVCRSYKLAKHSEYAPTEGIRYDGLYKIRKYWPEKGQAGFIVWRYLLERDDEAPAPWTDEGKAIIEREGFQCIYPEGYAERMAAKEAAAAAAGKGKGRGKKRKAENDDGEAAAEDKQKVQESKKPKLYTMAAEWRKAIDENTENAFLWEQVLDCEFYGRKELLDKVEEVFTCLICQDLIRQPVSLPCRHSLCLSCIKRGVDCAKENDEIPSCPSCRAVIPPDFELAVNQKLRSALHLMFGKYDAN